MGRPVSRRLIKDVEKTNLQEENMEDLKQENVDLKKQIESMQKDSSENVKVEADTYIDVVSLCPTLLTLSTASKGRGSSFTWNNFGDVQQIVYSDLQKIIQNHGNGIYTNFIKEGYVYIDNPGVVKRAGLKSVYEKLLTKEQVEKVLLCDSKECVELFKSTIKGQQLLICKMLISKITKGETLDLNIIDEISRISGVKIVDTATENKEYVGLNLKNSNPT